MSFHYEKGGACCVVLETALPTVGFFDDRCYRHVQLRLKYCQQIYGMQIHAYALLPQEMWLLATPLHPRSISSSCAYLNRSYSEYFKRRFKRKVQVWRGSPQVVFLGDDLLVLECQKLIERLPLERGLTSHPGCYSWSSYCASAFGGADIVPCRHRAVRRFITRRRFEGYREYLMAPFHPARFDRLQAALQRGTPPVRRAVIQSDGELARQATAQPGPQPMAVQDNRGVREARRDYFINLSPRPCPAMPAQFCW